MANIINLRQARKNKTRKQKEVKAGENRAIYGASKSAKHADKLKASLLSAQLDGHRLNPNKENNQKPDKDE